MTDSASPQPAKPGTACLGCRRRKLKCSREQEGCANCKKSDLPCVYPIIETGIKRKRGPYKKDKPARERHLEDLVKYLEPRTSTACTNAPGEASRPNNATAPLGALDSNGPRTATGWSETDGLLARDPGRSNDAEDLVKDALIALTNSSVSERERIAESGPTMGPTNPAIFAASTEASTTKLQMQNLFQYWQIFMTRVEPLTKIIHCPTFTRRISAVLDDPRQLDPPLETLLASIYYAAISTCAANEARRKFGERRVDLLLRYGRLIEAAVSDNYEMPALESLQALVLYIICVRRQDDGTSVRALFGLAVRMAQLMNLHEDPGKAYKPLEAELRRRLWWQICGLESRGAEEGGARNTSVMNGRNVKLPANLNDRDLDLMMTEAPAPHDGVTEMTFVLLRFEILRHVNRIRTAKQQAKSEGMPLDAVSLKHQLDRIFAEDKERLDLVYDKYLHPSRPLEWISREFIGRMLIKSRLIIDYPFGQIPNKDMTPEERLHLLQSSVEIIRGTHVLAFDPRIECWSWFFRGFVQWHSLAIVVAELGRSNNSEFARGAWAVVDSILAGWEKMYATKKGETAWDHVNALIERARQNRASAAGGQTDTVAAGSSTALRGCTFNATPEPSPCTEVRALPEHLASPRHVQPTTWTTGLEAQPQQALTPHSVDTFTPGNLAQAPLSGPPVINPNVDFGAFDSLDNIDFSAFDAVFGSTSWEFPSPLPEFDTNMGFATA